MKFSTTSNTKVQRCLYPLFQNQRPRFLPLHLFEKCLNPQVRSNKMVNEHTVVYHPSPSESTSRIHPPHISMDSEGVYLSIIFLFSRLYISLWLQKSFKFRALRLLENTSVSQKTESVHFYSYSQTKVFPQVFIISTLGRRNYAFRRNNVFQKSIFPQQKGRRTMKLKKWPKLNLQGCWSQVLINSTFHLTFTFLVSVLLCL